LAVSTPYHPSAGLKTHCANAWICSADSGATRMPKPWHNPDIPSHQASPSLSTSARSPQDELKPYHEAVIEFIKQKGFITDKDYAGLVERAKPTRRLDFNKLIEWGLIVREGKGKNTYYVLKEKQ
jgi:Fic family protein